MGKTKKSDKMRTKKIAIRKEAPEGRENKGISRILSELGLAELPGRFQFLRVILEDNVMYRMRINRTVARCVPIFCILLLSAGASQLQAGEDITGKWEFKMNFDERELTAKACFSKSEDGTYSGTWTPEMPQQPEGESLEGEKPELKVEISDIKFENGVLTFIQKGHFGDHEFEILYNGILKEGKLEGTFSGEQGDMPVIATRIKPPANPIGDWNIKHKVKDLQVKEKLTISKSVIGSLMATCESKMDDDVISEVKFEDGKLSFTRKCKHEEKDVEMSFEGTITCHKLTGKYTSEVGQWDVAGNRICPELVGKWELTTDTESGAKTAVLTIKDDMTGTYQSSDADVPIKDLNYEEGRLNFKIEMDSGDEQLQMDFKGELHGTAIDGEFTTPDGINKITGKKISADAKKAIPAPPSDTSSES